MGQAFAIHSDNQQNNDLLDSTQVQYVHIQDEQADAQPVNIDRGSIIKGILQSMSDGRAGFILSLASLWAVNMVGRLLALTPLNDSTLDKVNDYLATGAFLLPNIVASFWNVPFACKDGKYKDAVGGIVIAPFVLLHNFMVTHYFINRVIFNRR